MALIYCTECGKQVSDQAPTCPSCGAPIASAQSLSQQPAIRKSEAKDPWYYNSWFVALLFLGCWPVALILMWLAKRWPLWLRITLTVVCVLILISFLGGGNESTSPSQSLAPASQEVSVTKKKIIPTTFEEMDSYFAVDSNLTELQKDEVWREYKGSYVRWTGEISYIDESLGGIAVGIRHKPTTLTYDVLLRFPMAAKQQLLALPEGEIVTYTGKLNTRAGVLLPYGLKDVTLEEARE